MPHKLYFDGACLPTNPNDTVYYGWVLKDGFGRPVAEGNGHKCSTRNSLTNNDAEYIALIEALRAAVTRNIRTIEIFGDSQLVINQVTGRWGCHAPNLMPRMASARHLLKHFDSYDLSWIRRHKNSEADSLAQQAYTANKAA